MSDAVVRCWFASGSSSSGLREIAVRNLQRQVPGWIPGDPAAERIKLRIIEIVTHLVRLPSLESAPFNFQIAPDRSERDDAESHMRRVLPVMAERRVRIIHGGEPMHERRRPQRRFARITGIQIGGKIVAEPLRIADRDLIEQIVRMLPVVQRFAIPRFAGLKQERITAPALP